MILAQVPSLTFSDVGLIAMGIVLAMYVFELGSRIYRNWFPYVPPPKQGDLYVTHDQFDAFKKEVTNSIEKVALSMDQKISSFTKEFGTGLKDMDVYLHQSQHKQADHLQKQAIHLAQIQTILAMKFGLKDWADPPDLEENER